VDEEDWRSLIDYWRGQGHALQHLDIPDNIRQSLGIEIPKEKDMTEQTAQFEPVGAEWKRKKYFDGTTCGLKGCKRTPDGYLCDKKPTKGGENGRLWFGPACKKCVKKLGMHEAVLHTLSQLAYQRNGASDLALVLDIEVGEVLKRLEDAGIDEKGNVLTTGEEVQPTEVANTGAGAPVGAQQQEAQPAPTPENGTGHALAVVQAPAIQFSTADIEAQKAETDGVLAFLENFHVVDQATMDMAAGWLNGWLDPQGNKVPGIKAKWKTLDETRKALGKPLRDGLAQIQAYFGPALDALAEAEKVVKQKISEGNARAAQAQQQALAAAQQAYQAGDAAMVAQASQQAATADVSLPQGITQTMVTKFAVEDASQLPGQFWSPDPQKIQAAIDQGYTQIPGVRIWQEPSIRGSFK
jgi:hypothetical protein